MAKELSVLQQQAEAIKTEVNKGANTSSRIGGMFGDILEYNEGKFTELIKKHREIALFAKYLKKNYYLKNDGTKVSFPGWNTYEKIPVEKNDSFIAKFKVIPSLQDATAIVIFNSNGDVIETINKGSVEYIFTQDGFISFCYKNDVSWEEQYYNVFSFKDTNNRIALSEKKVSIRPMLSIVSYDTESPSFILNFETNKLTVNSRIFISDGNTMLISKNDIENYETKFVGSCARERLSFIIYNKETGKLLFVDFASKSSYPEYDLQGNSINICIGTIIKQSSGVWGFGFNFAHIQIDNVDYYGNTDVTKSFVNLKSNIRPNLSIYSFNTSYPTLALNTVDKKLKVNGRILICDSNSILVDRNLSIETAFIGDEYSNTRLSYLIYNILDQKVYCVDFAYKSSYPEYDSNSNNRINICIGTIIKQSTGVWGFGFNFAHIQIDGIDYYGDINSLLPLSPNEVSFIEKERTENLFDKNTCVKGYYGTTGTIFQDSQTYWCSDYIPVTPNEKYKVNDDQDFFMYCYGENKEIVKVDDKNYWQPMTNTFTIPDRVHYIKKVFRPNHIDIFMFAKSSVNFLNYIPYFRYKLSSEIEVEKTDNLNTEFNISDIGNLQYYEIGENDYAQLIMYGQSLSMGWESPEAITEPALKDVYMIGDKVAIRHGNNGKNILTPLVSTTASNCGENPTVGAINAFVPMYRRFMDKTQKFIATSCGEGGKSIEQLSKECTNGTNYYTDEFLNTLTRTKNTVDSEGKSVGCFAILFMQGEYNYVNLTGAGLTPGTDATSDKDTYKAYLKTLKDNMQADIMEKYGQKQKPLFFIYEVAGYYINKFDMPINMAQIEFALENDDVFLLNPTYFTPDYGGGHLSTNGYRWYGEMMAKTLYKVFVKGERFYPVFPQKYSISGNTIRIDMFTPVLPLIFDTWTKESVTNMGFRVQVNDSDVTINSIKIQNNAILITCNSGLTGKVAISYAGQGRNGSGNLRDSDTWCSYYTYYDDRETSPSKRENYTPLDKLEGQPIYGKPYPMFNWCSNFYKLIFVE